MAATFQGSRECRNSKEMPQMPADCFFQPFPQQPTAFFCGFSTCHTESAARSMCVWAGEWLSGEMRQCGFTAMQNLPASMTSLIRPASLSMAGANLLEGKVEKRILGIFYRSEKVWGTALWAAFIFYSSHKPYRVWLWEWVVVKRIRSAFRFATGKRNQQQPVVTEHCN